MGFFETGWDRELPSSLISITRGIGATLAQEETNEDVT